MLLSLEVTTGTTANITGIRSLEIEIYLYFVLNLKRWYHTSIHAYYFMSEKSMTFFKM